MKYIFVHIPKTAGTSFRLSAKQVMSCLWDYGPSSSDTSEVFKENGSLDSESNPYHAASVLQQINADLIAGHFHPSKYRKIFPEAKLVTFLRNPVDRFISEYNHHVRHGQYTGSLRQFCESFQTNKQSSFFEGLDIKDYDFIGFTEHYETSLEAFNKKEGLKLELLRANVAHMYPRKPLEVRVEDLSEQTIQLVTESNSQDILLYEEARKSIK